ncbi:MAG TPA: AI-2E family transporter, partial [Opitutus sp.]|nr:AI-2E family transporter [Opitutus sp.]
MNRSLQPRSITSYIVVALALAGLAVMIWRIGDVFVIGFGGIVLAVALRAMASPLARATRLSPRWSLTLVVVGLVLVSVAIGWFFGSQGAAQVAQLQNQLPKAGTKFIDWLQQSEMGRILVNSGRRAVDDSKTLAGVGIAAGAAISGAADALLVLFLAIYFAADPPLYREGALRLLPPTRRAQVRRALDDAGEALRKWLLAQGIAMVTVGILAGVSLALLGVPLAFSLGVLAGLFEFIPVVGPILSAVPGILLAFANGPELAIYTLITYTVVQQLESNVIVPLAQRWTMRLPPVVGLLAVLVCGFLFGMVGIVFATPMAVVVMAMVKHLYVEDT